jgi:Ca2+-binding RTX toxin-like protein
MIRSALPLAIAAAMVTCPAIAQAGEVSVVNSPSTGLTESYKAGAGEANDLHVDRDASHQSYLFADAGAPSWAGKGCTQSPDGALCPLIGIRLIDVLLKDNNDRASVVGQGSAVHISGGSGNDTAFADSFGQNTTVEGDGGDDDVTAESEGLATADGGTGDDTVTALPYGARGVANGGSGNDHVYLRALLYPSLAELDGGTGDDIVVSQPMPSGANVATGGDGDDVVAVHGSETLAKGAFTLTGGLGDDTIFGGYGPDTVDGGPGRDVIDVQGGGADTVTCGDDEDVVRYDAADTVAGDCEVKLGP